MSPEEFQRWAEEQVRRLSDEATVLRRNLDEVWPRRYDDNTDTALAPFTGVRLTQTGGSAGDDVTECSFTYTLKTFDNETTLATATGMTGHGQRTPIGAMTAGSVGSAVKSGGTWYLIWADEQPTTFLCVES